QVGVRGAGAHVLPADEAARVTSLPLAGGGPLALPTPGLIMVDGVEAYVPDGGQAGLGFVRGVKHVDPEEWFFKAHFYQDPVCPGSLGLESYLQLLKVVA